MKHRYGEMLCGLCVQQSLVAECPLQRRLHLHGPEFLDSEVQVPAGFSLLVGWSLDEELSQLEVREGDLRPEADRGADFEGLLVIGARLLALPEKRRGTAENTRVAHSA